MLRQVGLAIGVAVLVAVLGTPGDAHAVLDAFDRACSWPRPRGRWCARVAGDPRDPPPSPYAAPAGALAPIDLALAEEA
jgi:hypothetical protein